LDNLTHSLFGLTLARTPLGRGGRASTIALVLASNAPDIDIVATAGGSAKYLEWHRGPTHGLPGVIGLGLVVAAIGWLIDRKWGAAEPMHRPGFRRFWIIAMIGVACHVLMDLPTSYGTRPFSPFAWTWFAQDWEPIVDIYLLAILAAGLWFGRVTDRTARVSAAAARTRNAVLALGLMMVNYGIRATAHHEAIARAHEVFGAQLPVSCPNITPDSSFEHWPRNTALVETDGASRCLVEIAAMPDFLSPFRWRLIAHLSNAFEVRTVDLLSNTDRATSSDVRIVAIHYPNVWTPAVFQAAQSPVAQVFLGFSRFPAARSVVGADGAAIVRWNDLRFTADTAPGIRERAPNLFTATVQLDSAGKVVHERLGSQ
jgi:inner membrane protein